MLEEGQTKDLTIMVGHKLEEGTSSKEVQDLKVGHDCCLDVYVVVYHV